MTRESSPIVEFITARLDEEERTARECLESVGGYLAGEPYPDGSGAADRDAYPSYPWGSDEVELTYMARTRPALTLRKIAALRKLLDAHLGYYGAMDDEHLPVPALSILAAIWDDHEDYPSLVGTVTS